MKRIVLCMFVMMLLAGSTFAAADWEWSKDKGWTMGLGKPKDTPAKQLKFAWSLEKEGRYINAAKQYFLLLKSFPDSEEAGVGLQRLAKCLFQMENYYDSYKALEQVIKTYPFSAKKSDLIKIEFLIGREFQKGARRDLLNDKESPAVAKSTAVEIFKSVVANDPVGPYAGAALLAIGYCYRDLNNPEMGLVYANRVISDFSGSAELVSKARVLKKILEVMQGAASTVDLKKEMGKTKAILEENEGDMGTADFAPVNDYKDDLKDLEEMQAKKMWDAANYYKRRGSSDSVAAYKFSLEQLIIRYPTSSYASKAKAIVGTVKVPKKKNSFGKINNPFAAKKKEASFRTANINPDVDVQTENVPVPGADDQAPDSNIPAAGANPHAPPVNNVYKDYEFPQPKRGEPAVAATPAASPTFEQPAKPKSVPAKKTSSEPAFEKIPEKGGVPRGVSTAKATPGDVTPESSGESARKTRTAPMAPVGYGASAVPAFARYNSTPRRKPSTETIEIEESVTSVQPSTSPARAGAIPNASDKSLSGQSRPSLSPIPEQEKIDRVPMDIAPVKDTSAESDAREKANEKAAGSSKWKFSEDFN